LIVALYGQGKTRGQVSELLIEATINQACAAIVLEDLEPQLMFYIKLFFLKNYQDLRSLAEGGAQPNLNVGKIKSLCIPLPPLAEQKRIVEKVEALLTLCEQVQAGLVAAEEARQRLLGSLLHRVGVGPG
jgi:type I restriction enzyme S subunit